MIKAKLIIIRKIKTKKLRFKSQLLIYGNILIFISWKTMMKLIFTYKKMNPPRRRYQHLILAFIYGQALKGLIIVGRYKNMSSFQSFIFAKTIKKNSKITENRFPINNPIIFHLIIILYQQKLLRLDNSSLENNYKFI